jgi:large subunit ribosomal protein L9
MAARIEGQQLSFRVRAGEEGRLYGSVTNGDVAEVLSRQIGEDVDKRRVILDEPIHVLGTYEVPVRLSASHSPVVKVVVEAEG